MCTALAVGCDDVASCYSISVLTRRQVGRREGSWGARVVTSCYIGVFRSPAYQSRRSPGSRMKSPDVDSGDLVIGDRQSKHIAEDEGEADYECGRRDHREGV